MKIKRNALPNKTATDMPIEDSHQVLSHGSRPCQPSTSLSQNVTATNFPGLRSTVGSDSGDGQNDTGTNTCCVSHISAAAPIGPQNRLVASQGVIQNLHQLHVGVGVNVVAQSCHHPVSAVSVDGNAAAFVPVQMATVNGSVSAVTADNVGASFLGAGSDVPACEGGSTGAVPGLMNEATPIFPMVLDFSVVGSSGADPIPTGNPTFATRPRRTRRPRAPASRQHRSAGATRARRTRQATRAGCGEGRETNKDSSYFTTLYERLLCFQRDGDIWINEVTSHNACDILFFPIQEAS